MPRGVVLLLTALVVAGCTGGTHNSTGNSGDQLTVDLHAQSLPGQGLSKDLISRTAGLVTRRLRDVHVASDINQGDGTIRMTVPSAAAGRATTLATTRGVLRYRQVLAMASGSETSGSGVLPAAASTSVRVARRAFARYACTRGPGGSALMDGADKATDYIVACDQTGTTKYLLAPAGVGDDATTEASAVEDTLSKQWMVELTFTRTAAEQWYVLTKKAYEADPSQSPTTCQTANVSRGCNEIAIVMDGVVLSAPSSQQDGISGGGTQITGQFTRQEAEDLAAILDSGPLPVRLGVA